MRVSDFYSANNLVAVHTEAGSNKVPFLFESLFPSAKKAGLTLKSIRTHKGATIALKPSAFDAKSTLRSREGFSLFEQEMAYFKESMVVKEEDEQKLMDIADASSQVVVDVMNNIFDDANTLIESANVIPEIMRSQIMANENGKPSISLVADNATYIYDYDPDDTYHDNNFLEVLSAWSDTEASDPLADIETAKGIMQTKYGVIVDSMVINSVTLGWLKANKALKNYVLAQNTTANVYMGAKQIKELFLNELGITIYVYDKVYVDYEGNSKKFYPNGMVTLFPSNVALGKTYYGMTPEERTGVLDKAKDVKIVDTGVAVGVTITDDPIQTKTTVSEIVLPSFENILSTYMLKVGAVSYTI